MQHLIALSALVLSVLFQVTLCSSMNSELKGCSVSSNKENSNVRRFFNVKDYEYNFPKTYEALRILSVFSWDLPVLGIYGDGNEWNYYFGNFNSNTSFAIYRNHSDWYASKNPCDVIHGKEIFGTKEYVEVETILSKGEAFVFFFFVILNKNLQMEGFQFLFTDQEDSCCHVKVPVTWQSHWKLISDMRERSIIITVFISFSMIVQQVFE